MTKPNVRKNQLSMPDMIRVDGRYINVQRVECANECGSVDMIKNNRFNGLLPETMIKKILHEHGWEVKGSKAVCPSCQEKKRRVAIKVVAGTAFNPPPMPPEGTTVLYRRDDITGEPVTLATFTAPKGDNMNPTLKSLTELGDATKLDLTPDVRRMIFRAIDDSWDEKAKRYIGNNSDEFLSRDLKVPRAWIESIRKEAFGEIGSNDDLEALKLALPEIESAVHKYVEDANKVMAGVTNLVDRANALFEDVKAIRQRLGRVEAAILPKR